MENKNNTIKLTEEETEELIDFALGEENQHDTFDYLIRDLTGNFNDELSTKEKIINNLLHTFYEMTVQMCAKITADKYGYKTFDTSKLNEYANRMNETYISYMEISKKENKKHGYLYDIKPTSKMN